MSLYLLLCCYILFPLFSSFKFSLLEELDIRILFTFILFLYCLGSLFLQLEYLILGNGVILITIFFFSHFPLRFAIRVFPSNKNYYYNLNYSIFIVSFTFFNFIYIDSPGLSVTKVFIFIIELIASLSSVFLLWKYKEIT